MEELISVIVPVYGVESYLPRCVESILSQTYSNLEIILVDDGSPDGCPVICDDYAQKDSRIRVIHKENGGLSDARNVGINIAKGSYLAFVDSDDDIAQEYIQVLYTAAKKYEADITVVGMKQVFEDFPPVEDNNAVCLECCYGTKDAIWELLTMGNLSQEACGKLYRSELFDGIRFPVGELFEDLAIMYHLFLRAERVAYSSRPLYRYYIREGSIMQSPFDLRQYVEVRWIEEAMALVSQRYPELNDEIRGRRVWSYFKTLYRILCSKDPDQYRTQQEEMIRKIRRDTPGLLTSRRIGRNLKVKIISLYFGRYGFYCVQKLSDFLKQRKAGYRYTV